jgi:hypothetical protein
VRPTKNKRINMLRKYGVKFLLFKIISLSNYQLSDFTFFYF